MPTGARMLDLARQHIGEAYVNIQVPKNNANWRGPWDCAEFMSWLVYQEARILYGCLDNTAAPAIADAYTGAWQRDSGALGQRISVAQAAGTVGGIVLRYPPEPGAMGHIAICDGHGGTVEAKGQAYGVVADTVQGRRWDTGVLIPGVTYSNASAVPVTPPARIYYRGQANMDGDVVRAIQSTLLARGFNPGPVDGIFGSNTAAAVQAFQGYSGLVVDGEVGPQTAAVLGITL